MTCIAVCMMSVVVMLFLVVSVVGMLLVVHGLIARYVGSVLVFLYWFRALQYRYNND